MKYRPEIDGLRALAVIPVVFFHMGLDLFAGGFVGVDVFFVISGYLITLILIEDLGQGRFSFFEFYERRARRILPALFITTIVTIIFAWVWMMPSQLKDFSQSVAALALFVSNVLFLIENDYFAPLAETKPMLHTWSLAVEGQFYIIFPLVVFAVWRTIANHILIFLILMMLLSFGLCEWALRENSTANFYLAPTRAWELLAGSVCAILIQKYGIIKNGLISIVGLLAIVTSILLYNDHTPTPSAFISIPVIGTMLVILFSHQSAMTTRILSTSILVKLGLLSYSLYLLHNPILVFGRLQLKSPNDAISLFGAFFLSLFLAYLTWRFVEIPFRNREIVKKKIFLNLSIFTMACLVGFGFFGHHTSGTFWRAKFDTTELQAAKRQNDIFVSEQKNFLHETEFNPNKINMLIVGDSNSGDFLNAIQSTEHAKNLSIVTLDASTVCSFMTPEIALEVSRCNDKNRVLTSKQIGLMEQADTIVLAYQWRLEEAGFVSAIAKKIESKFNARLWLVGTKQTDTHPTDFEYNYLFNDNRQVIAQAHSEDLITNEIISEDTADFINPFDWLCDTTNCLVYSKDTSLIQYDGFHLTPEGANLFGKWLVNNYAQIFAVQHVP